MARVFFLFLALATLLYVGFSSSSSHAASRKTARAPRPNKYFQFYGRDTPDTDATNATSSGPAAVGAFPSGSAAQTNDFPTGSTARTSDMPSGNIPLPKNFPTSSNGRTSGNQDGSTVLTNNSPTGSTAGISGASVPGPTMTASF